MSFYFPVSKSERKSGVKKCPGTGSLSRLVVPITANFECAPVSEGSTE